MANIIQIKRGTGTSTLANGELGFNTNTNILYIGNSGNKAIGGAGAFLPLSGGTLTGDLIISKTTTALTELRVKNSNEELGLSIDTSNKGLYDYKNTKWVCYSQIGTSSWLFNGTATKATTADTATNATNATTADKVKNALTIQGNGVNLNSFDGSSAKTINITPSNIGALPTTGGTLTGSLRINTSSTSGGGVLINEDGEGGTITITSKSGTYNYEIDAVSDNSIRMHNASTHPNSYRSISWNADTGNLWTDSLQLSSALAINYGGTGATNITNARTNLQVPHLDGNVVNLGDNQRGIGLATNNGNWWQFWAWGDGNGEYYAALAPTLSGKQKLGTPSMYIDRVYSNYYSGTWDGDVISVSKGGTGATTASGARANLGVLSNAGDTANGSYTINGALTIQNTSNQKITLNNTNTNGESSIGFNNAGILKWVLGIGCGDSGNTFALWNNNLDRNDITVDNSNGQASFMGAIIAKDNSSSGYAKMWGDDEGGNIQIRSKSGTYDYQWDAYQDNHMRFFVQNTAGSVVAAWNYWPHSGCFTTKAININNTDDITGITYSGSAPAGSTGHIWLKPIS